MNPEVSKILNQTKTLSSEEQLALAIMLVEQVRKKTLPQTRQRRWLDVVGAAAYPLTGQDAQDWVTHSRQE